MRHRPPGRGRRARSHLGELAANLVLGLCLLANAAAQAAPPALGDLRRALLHAEGRPAALSVLARPDARTLRAARDAGYGELLAGVAADPAVPLEERLRALRLTALYAAPGPRLTVHLQPAAAAEPGTPAPPGAEALAREAARALATLGRADLLAAAASHADPEVRALALGAGGDPQAACAALGIGGALDPWPFVRRAAVVGLSGDATDLPCLEAALADRDPLVREAAVVAAGESGQVALRDRLRPLAGDARAPVPLRAEAVVALARLGDPAPAQRILETHRSKGGIVPLALAAVRAVSLGAGAVETLVALSEASPEAAVRIAALEALAGRDRAQALAAAEARLGRARDPGERRALQALAERLRPASEAAPDLVPDESDEPD